MSFALGRQARRKAKRQMIKAKVRSGPVNRSFIIAGFAASIAEWSWPANNWFEEGLQSFTAGISAAVAGALALQGVVLLTRDYWLRRNLALSLVVSSDHGEARQSTSDERRHRGMDSPRHGELYGLDEKGQPVWRPAQTPFSLVEMPPGIGKTSFLVVGSILHRAMLGYSVIVPDVKTDLGPMLVRHLRALGFETWAINPGKSHLERTRDTAINPYQPVIDAIYGSEGERKDAVKLAADFAALHNPLSRDEKNPYFIYGSRRATGVTILILAIVDPANCTPTQVARVLNDPNAFLKLCRQIQLFDTNLTRDEVLEVAKSEARNMLHRAKKNEENWSSFLEGATQRLLSFNAAGHLGDYGREAIHNLKTIRERQVIVFIMAPLSHTREFADFVSLVNHNIIAACKAKPDGHPVHLVGEETLAYRFQDLAANLETLRQLRFTADFYIQSFAGLVRQYGKDEAAALESYSDIRVYSGLNSYERAKHVSDMLAEATLKKQDASYGASVTEMNLASREIGRPYMKPDEIMAMPAGTAWMFVRGLRPVLLQLVHYGQVSPWSDWVDPSPITGTRLHGKTLVRVDYAAMGINREHR